MTIIRSTIMTNTLNGASKEYQVLTRDVGGRFEVSVKWGPMGRANQVKSLGVFGFEGADVSHDEAVRKKLKRDYVVESHSGHPNKWDDVTQEPVAVKKAPVKRLETPRYVHSATGRDVATIVL